MGSKNLTADTLFKTSKSEQWKDEHDNMLGIFSNNVNKNQNQAMTLQHDDTNYTIFSMKGDRREP